MSEVIKHPAGHGKVTLIAGGGKIYTDIAARFCRSEKSVEEIIASPYSKEIVESIVSSGHLAATEFDTWIFGVEGYSRVCETQLVRKRIASYLIKSGREELDGKRKFEVCIPRSVENFSTLVKVKDAGKHPVTLQVDSDLLLKLISDWYDEGIRQGVPEEDLRFLKPQATMFKAIISMNTHSLIDWFKIRCCKRAQHEIRDMANQMLGICKKHAPDLFAHAGPSCVVYGYCPENERQHPSCRGRVMTKKNADRILQIAQKRNFTPEDLEELRRQEDDLK